MGTVPTLLCDFPPHLKVFVCSGENILVLSKEDPRCYGILFCKRGVLLALFESIVDYTIERAPHA